MDQPIIRALTPGTLEVYRAVAAAKGRSLEAELRAVLEAHAPRRAKDSVALLRLSDQALAMTPPDGSTDTSDSTLLIRRDRDTDGERHVDDGWSDDDARP